MGWAQNRCFFQVFNSFADVAVHDFLTVAVFMEPANFSVVVWHLHDLCVSLQNHVSVLPPFFQSLLMKKITRQQF